MSEPEIPISEIIKIYRDGQNYNYTAMSMLALLTYDMFCTFGEEVEVIWKRKFSVPTFLYLAIRLCTWGYFVFGTSLTYIPTTITNILLVGSLFAYAGVSHDLFELDALSTHPRIEAFNTLRVWAIWGRHWFPVLLVLPFALIPPCMNAYTSSHTSIVDVTSNPLPFGVCLAGIDLQDSLLKVSSYSSLSAVTRSSVIVTNLLVLILTWVKTYGIRKAAVQAGLQSDLVTLIMRDVLRVASILFTRFILKLRIIDHNNVDPDVSMHNSTIQFAAGITGNIGAPLEYADSDFEETCTRVNPSIQQQIQNPLAIGILDVDMTGGSR
ncbi:hypothetical protein NLI96_g11177 [Meripilus lineatus]|uniref:DUF6533 domain-containing protein n=1 Tax=Meripilus lineatus TaxID=2056292 RepID=A0AAD5UWH0_9APHY|nr:hypothetical protein NLI96_g11177 [Physisporinus lineatus]